RNVDSGAERETEPELEAGGDAGRDVAAGDVEAGGTQGDGGIPKGTPLPDGSGNLRLKTTGGLTLDVRLGNDQTFDGTWTPTEDLLLTFFVPVPPVDAEALPPGLLSINIPDAQPGATATAMPTSLEFLSSGRIWSSSTACTSVLSTNQKLSAGPAYK